MFELETLHTGYNKRGSDTGSAVLRSYRMFELETLHTHYRGLDLCNFGFELLLENYRM